jgi:(p)ppGpp synthase/HD superfamily hydrolase
VRGQASSGAGGRDGRDLLARLLAVVAAARPDADAALISRAYDVAAGVHAGQIRKSGDPYIIHPVGVAAILAQAGADDQILCAALLHDTLEVPGHTLDRLRSEFGAGVADLVAGAAGLDMDSGSSTQMPGSPASTSAADAIPNSGMLMIKLADRLHNLRTAAPLPLATRLGMSRDTLEVLVPLAARLGLNDIRAELEDLAAGIVSRYGTGRVPVSGRLLAAAAGLLPASARSRWRDEWAGELSALPAWRQRAAFAAKTLAGVPRMAATLRRPPQA